MTRQEKQALLEDYLTFVEGNDEWQIEAFLDSLEMNKEKAISTLVNLYLGNNLLKVNEDAIRFAIDYMKKEEAEGEIIGWVNYYPDRASTKFGAVYESEQEVQRMKTLNVTSFTLPIRKPI